MSKINQSVMRSAGVLEALTLEHDAVRAFFQDYERLLRLSNAQDRKAALVGQLCFDLCQHSQLEEQVFYPALRVNDALVAWTDAAMSDHQGDQILIARLDEMEPGDADYDATIALLKECVLPHMAREENELFPQLRELGLVTDSLAEQMNERRNDLRGDITSVVKPRNASVASGWPAACRMVLGG